MAEHSAGFRVYADATQFEKGMAQAARSADSLGKKLSSAFDGKAIGRTLTTALGLSLTELGDKVARFATGMSKDMEAALKKVAEYGEQTAAIYASIFEGRRTTEQNIQFVEKENNSIARERITILESLTKRQKEYDDQWAKAKNGGVVTLPNLGRRPGFTPEEAVRLAEISKAQADNIVKLEGLKKEVESEQVKRDKADEDRQKARSDRSKKDIADLDKEMIASMEAAEALRAFDKEQAEAKMNDAQRLQSYRKEALAYAKEIKALEKLGDEGRTTEQNVVLLSMKKEQVTLQEKIKELVEKTAVAEAKVTEEVKAQIEQIKFSRTGRDNANLSDRELAAKEKNLRQELFKTQLLDQTMDGLAGLILDSLDPMKGFKQGELQSTLAEIGQRKATRRNVAAFGEDRAFQLAGVSEQRFADIVRGTTETQQLARRTAEGIERLNEIMRGGIPVVQLGKG